MRFLFTCGGTAGHINPALAVAGKLRELSPDPEFLFIGAKGNMELELVPREGYRIEAVAVDGLLREMSLHAAYENFKAVGMLIKSFSESKKIISEFAPDAVIGTGGYVCYPVLKQAHNMGIPTIVHESNAVPGLTTQMLARDVDRILVGFSESKKYYKNSKNVIATGTPVRGDFAKWTYESARHALKLSDRPLVVSFWGSLGASDMNEKTAQLICKNEQIGAFQHIHAVGNADSGMKKMLHDLDIERPEQLKHTDLRQYIFDMPCVMMAADLILCRSGASTLSELMAIGKPAVLVPSPYVTNNHQEKNAEIPAKRGAAVLIRENECSGDKLFETITELVSDPDKLRRMSEQMYVDGFMNSAEQIAKIVLDTAGAN